MKILFLLMKVIMIIILLIKYFLLFIIINLSKFKWISLNNQRKIFLIKLLLQIQKEKEEKNKRKFFDGLILYSNLKKVIDITDKIIYHEKFCTLKFNVYKNIGEFITLQKL